LLYENIVKSVHILQI